MAVSDFVRSVAYWTVDELVDAKLRWTNDEWESLAERLQKTELAIIDELCQREKIGDAVATILQRVCDYREQAGFATIYISNYGPVNLAELYGDRIASRILRGTVFHLQGDDRRFA